MMLCYAHVSLRPLSAIAQAYADYSDMMKLTEKLVSGAAMSVLGTTTVSGADVEGSPPEVDLKAPWRRVTMNELVREKVGKQARYGPCQRTTTYKAVVGVHAPRSLPLVESPCSFDGNLRS